MLTGDVEEALRIPGEGKLLIITAGNTLRGDDGVGPYIGESVAINHPRLGILNTGDRPEDALSAAGEMNPSRCLVIDAAVFGGAPGEARMLPEKLIPDKTLSTHTFPLKIVTSLLRSDTGADILFLGIQPEKVSFGEGLSAAVKKTADEIIHFINSGERDA